MKQNATLFTVLLGLTILLLSGCSNFCGKDAPEKACMTGKPYSNRSADDDASISNVRVMPQFIIPF